MDPTPRVTLIAGHGIEGNASVGGKRHVTVLSLERWREVERSLGRTISPSARRANVLVSGIDLADARGKLLRLGSARIAVRGETRPCEQMDEASSGLRAALSPPWAGGLFGEVAVGGVIAIGDPASWDDGVAHQEGSV